MAFFALLWKARTIEKYRQNYEKEKINSIVMGHTQMEQTLSQRWRHYRYDTQKRISRTFKRWYPEGSGVANFFFYLRTDQTFPNFLLKSMMGFVGGIILTYLCFMFFVFQLSISLIHATIMSSIIGVLLTLGLAFSYRIRCLVFLLIPQFFSRVGRYTLTCYALVLILTGPATNTLKNSEVLSESMACSQEQIKTSIHQLNDLIKKPYNSMKDAIKLMIERLKDITMLVKETVVKLDRLVLSIVSVIQSSFSWLQSVADICNAKLGTPYDRCTGVLQEGISECKKTLGPDMTTLCNVAYIAQAACYSVKPFKAFCYVTDFMDEAILASVKKKLRHFTEHLRAMFHVEVHIHHAYSYSSNTSRSASQVAAGIVTEIRNRADPLLTWLSWSSCVTSLFLLLIIFRAKYYQHMYETRSRFDNRYVTKELQELDLKRQRQGRETILPLNRRERAKYITTTSFRLVASEKVYLNRSAVFMAITTFKLLIHMVADYSLYWVLMTIRYHGGFQSDLMPGIPHSGVHVSGSGFVARLFRSIVGTLDIPLTAPSPSPISCLPNPYPPDFRRYTQIGVLIFLLWFFALFEPYGLRLRHLIMGLYRPERARARATWLYNHILRTRAGFMKFARRKLHREYKYTSESSLTFRQWVEDHIPFRCLRSLLGMGPKEPHCLLCGATYCPDDPDSKLTRCQTPNCPGTYCSSCFADIGQLCTICLTPADYGDLSDLSLEKGSSDDEDEGGPGPLNSKTEYTRLLQIDNSNRSTRSKKSDHRRWQFFMKTGPTQRQDTLALLASKLPTTYIDDRDFSNTFQSTLRKIKRNMQIGYCEKKYTRDWIAKLSPEYMYNNFSTEDTYEFYSDIFDFDQSDDFGDFFSKTKSIGINTDKNRGVILNTIMNRFARRKIKRSHTNKRKNPNVCLTSDKEVYHFENRPISKSHRKFTTKGQILELHLVQPHKRSLILTKKFHGHKLATRVIKVARCKKKQKTKCDIKIFKAVNGFIKAIKTIANSNDQITTPNQNNDTAPNKKNAPIENNADITKTTDNTNYDGKRNNKKTSKSYKSKRLGKQKGVVKLKTKNSRHRIAEFHTFFSKHWNNIKCSMIPCTSTQTRSEAPIPKEKRNHKRRKKRKTVDCNETELDQCFAKKDIRHTRNLRISAFLAELEWTKRDYKKNKDCDVNDDSFFFADGVAAPITTNKIVGMVQLKNLPFQWREAPRYDFCQCQDKKCTCGKDGPEKRCKLFAPGPKRKNPEEKVYAKKALERFRNKINSAVDTPSSLVQKMLSTMNVCRNRSSINQESSICISKRTSFYRQFTHGIVTQDSDGLDTDMLFKNENFLDEFMPDSHETNQVSTSKYSASNTFIGRELIVSRSSKDSKKTIITRRCRCDLYDDLQRRWTNVKKTLSDKGFRKPVDMMKNFCSSLFGPSCTIETCPNKREKQDQVKQEKVKAKLRKKESKLKNAKKKTATQTSGKKQPKQSQMAIQTQPLKDTETQLASDSEIDVDKEIEKQCHQELQLLKECEERQRQKLEMTQVHEKGKESDTVTRISGRDADDEATRKGSDICCRNLGQEEEEGIEPELEDKAVDAAPETASGVCQADCPDVCNRSMQYDDKDFKNSPVQSEAQSEIKCLCDAWSQVVPPAKMFVDEQVGTKSAFCTCATQHVSITNKISVGTKPSPIMVESATFKYQSPVANKKIQRNGKQVAHKGTHYVARRTHGKKGRDVKIGMSRRRRKLSLESSLCVFDKVHRKPTVAKALQNVLSDTITDTSLSSLSLRSDETKTDTTICSLATIDYDDTPRRRKYRVKVVTKTNQATLTDKTRLCDTGTITNDWWSPIVERKAHDEILLEKKKGYNTIEKQKKELREYKEQKELKEVRKRRRNCGMTTDGRIVTFRSRTQIIPSLFPGTNDILSPSRYLLESQKYYNELFAYNFRPPPQVEYTCATQLPKYQEKEKIRSPRGTRRNHYYKTKRLDECYSPRRQISPRKWYPDSNTKTSDSPRRRSYTHRHSKNVRYNQKLNAPRKIV